MSGKTSDSDPINVGFTSGLLCGQLAGFDGVRVTTFDASKERGDSVDVDVGICVAVLVGLGIGSRVEVLVGIGVKVCTSFVITSEGAFVAVIVIGCGEVPTGVKVGAGFLLRQEVNMYADKTTNKRTGVLFTIILRK